MRKYKDGFEFDSILFPFNKSDAIKIDFRTHSIDEYRKYITEMNIEQALIPLSHLDILRFCPSLKYIKIYPPYGSPKQFDLSALYNASEIKSLQCQNCYGIPNDHISIIDFAQINGIVDLSTSINEGTLHYDQLHALKSLCVGDFVGKSRNLTDLFCSKELDTLRLIQCKILSLDGIETSSKLQYLYLDHNRSLHDISALKHVKKTLKTMRIINCPKINDFSFLGELENLELLELSGPNTLPNLNFLKYMKNLKTFIFSMNVLDGDLSPCLNLSYAYSEKNHKHYNLKDADLPKKQYVRGNETIEIWRRLE